MAPCSRGNGDPSYQKMGGPVDTDLVAGVAGVVPVRQIPAGSMVVATVVVVAAGAARVVTEVRVVVAATALSQCFSRTPRRSSKTAISSRGKAAAVAPAGLAVEVGPEEEAVSERRFVPQRLVREATVHKAEPGAAEAVVPGGRADRASVYTGTPHHRCSRILVS